MKVEYTNAVYICEYCGSRFTDMQDCKDCEDNHGDKDDFNWEIGCYDAEGSPENYAFPSIITLTDERNGKKRWYFREDVDER